MGIQHYFVVNFHVLSFVSFYDRERKCMFVHSHTYFILHMQGGFFSEKAVLRKVFCLEHGLKLPDMNSKLCALCELRIN